MCGIAGILRFDGAPADPRQAVVMARWLAHRGPDGEGIRASGPVALAHRRLSIIDLSDRGAQPMANEDESLWLVHNGEIYNYLELRSALQERGHAFRSACDSEVILHSYEEEDIACTTRFNGMWAFAIWDDRKRRLILSRDRLGEKPLYYYAGPGCLLFASEIKALLAVRPELVEPSFPEVAQFIATGLMETGSDTFFRHVLQLPPAHTLVAGSDGRIRLERYWAPPDPSEVRPCSAREASRGLRILLEDSVRLRLRSDVPVGTCLSGGVDSSSLVALESRLLDPLPVHTFSSVFNEDGFSERPFIEAINSAFPTVAYQTSPSSAFLQALPRLVWHQESPIPGPGIYPQWCVMELARGKVKVLLDGQGADELLGGYFYYYPDHLADLFHGIGRPDGWLRLLTAFVRIPRRIPPIQALRFVREAVGRLQGRRRESGFQGGWFAEYLTPEFSGGAEEFLPPDASTDSGFLPAALFQELTRTSLPKLLHFEDRNSMAHGIEARVPFLDHRLVEFCFRLPSHRRIAAGVTKAPLRRAVRRELPPRVTRRIDKKGFPEPLAHWIRGEQFDAVAELLLSARTRSRGIFRIDRIQRALEEHRHGAFRTVPLYRALTLEIWLRLFQDGEGPARFGGDLAGEIPMSATNGPGRRYGRS